MLLVNNTRKMLPFVRAFSSKSTEFLNTRIDKDDIAVITLKNPPVNALKLEMIQDLNKAFEEVERLECKGMILTSDSPNIFSAGLDLMDIYKPDPERVRKMWKAFQDCAIKLLTTSVVSTAAINGHAAAGGCALSILTDYRVMVDGKFAIGLNETAVGIVPPVWLMVMMSHVISPRKAELALTGSTMFPPVEALKVGLIDELASDKTNAIEKCKQYLKSVQDVPRKVLATTKQRAKRIPLQQLQDDQKENLEEFVNMIVNPETQALMDAYIKRLKQKGTAS